MTYAEFLKLCSERHSTRFFDEVKQVTMPDVTALLDAARLAPSVQNVQPWHFHVIFDPALRTTFMQTCCYGNFIAGASVLIVVTCDKTSLPESKNVVWNPRELEYSCVAAMEHILLGATAMGIAGTWVSLHHGASHDALKLPKDDIIIGAVMLGYMKTGEEKTNADEHARKELSTMYTIY